MNEYNYQKEVNEAVQCANNALYWLNDANQYLKTARDWGIIDILGGGVVSTLVKHSRIDKARASMEQAKYAVKSLKNELQDVARIEHINLEVGEFLTFADFFFDGFVADWLVQSKIRETQRQINDAITQITYIKNQLLTYR